MQPKGRIFLKITKRPRGQSLESLTVGGAMGSEQLDRRKGSWPGEEGKHKVRESLIRISEEQKAQQVLENRNDNDENQ